MARRSAVAVIQARMSSTRLPGKVLRRLGDRPVLDWVVRAALHAGVFDDVILATSVDSSDDEVAAAGTTAGASIARGSLDDVLDRYLTATAGLPGETAVARLTADCPLLDPTVIAMAVRAFVGGDVDYLSTVTPRSLPRGMDVEVTSAGALREVAQTATGVDRVHVTSALYRDPDRYRIAGLTFQPPAADLRVTLDTPEDAAALDRIVAGLGDGPHPWRTVVEFLRSHPDVAAINAAVSQKQPEEG